MAQDDSAGIDRTDGSDRRSGRLRCYLVDVCKRCLVPDRLRRCVRCASSNLVSAALSVHDLDRISHSPAVRLCGSGFDFLFHRHAHGMAAAAGKEGSARHEMENQPAQFLGFSPAKKFAGRTLLTHEPQRGETDGSREGREKYRRADLETKVVVFPADGPDRSAADLRDRF